MMVYRTLVVGLLGAIALLVAERPTFERAEATPVVLATAPASEAAVVDVSRAIAGADPIPLLGLHPGERVVEIDGVAADAIELAGRWAQAFPGEYVDVGVSLAGGSSRRILVLVHP
jgi:hypothetical protein